MSVMRMAGRVARPVVVFLVAVATAATVSAAQEVDEDGMPIRSERPATTTVRPSAMPGSSIDRRRRDVDVVDDDDGLSFGRRRAQPAPAAPAAAPVAVAPAVQAPTRPVEVAPNRAASAPAAAPIAAPIAPAAAGPSVAGAITAMPGTETPAAVVSETPVTPTTVVETAPLDPARRDAAADTPSDVPAVPLVALLLAAAAALGAAFAAAKILMPYPRPRVRCEYDVAPAILQGGAMALHPPEVTVSAMTSLGAPTLTTPLTVEEGGPRNG